MNQRTVQIIQIIGELAIPLLGFFLWNWSLMFILLFYIIENLFLVYFRIETIRQIKILVLKTHQSRDVKKLIQFLFLWFLESVLIHLFIRLNHPETSFISEWRDFIMYQDMGIPQGIVLIPLMLFVSRMKMKQDVILEIKKMNESQDITKIKINYSYHLIAIAFWGILIGLNVVIYLPETLNVFFALLLFVYRAIQRN